MKIMLRSNHHILLLIFCFVSLTEGVLRAQDIPNPGFENWSGGEPDGWNTINQTILGTTFTPVTREQSNPHGGSYSAKLETITHNIFIVGPVTMPGVLSLGEITLDILNQTGTVEGGVPVSGAPVVLRGWFRYQPSANDSCIMGIGLSRWNGTTRDTLAYAYLTIGGQHPAWQEFSLPIAYLTPEQPDTMNIMFFSSNLLTGSPVTGSKLWVDDLWLEYGTVSVNDVGLNAAFRVFAVNNGQQLEVRCPNDNGGILQLVNLNGTILEQKQLPPGDTPVIIDIQGLKPALYIVRHTDGSGLQHVVKFVKN